ncbi:hypothetical protein AGABI1DRAFT_106493 [Agaricus bisporus var. burnettii JB137-S8]|uniref:DUF6534 domain-containing protein n=1 Tax=Agaricus bisporus var. burnettii (strain JB137-S8 / ATCC MYA-4627 / FGSC 10392) TaxID=597362 RepID=K5XB24_AGABU|nr:uncharacterized protein AGABI1DRAFT_106493 [Agaricus bisporus var. burnettii JB137-S8]EKM80267.1 hypothetical protein AGABI1DRAFT_106493 [Agaricus bisporus var. burnettii JB137-S8]
MPAGAHLIKVDNTLGAAFIGVICAAALYGVSCIQTLYYFTRYPKDVWYIKSLVGLVWVFDTIHQCLICHTVYFYLVTNFSNSTSLADMIWSILLEVLFNGLIGFLVQAFLTLRVWRLSGNNLYITSTIACLVVAEFGCSIAFTVQALQLRTWEELKALKGLSITVNILAVVPDVFIAASLFFFLQRSRTGFKKSDTMITRLIVFTVSTGVFTSICAIASLVSILVWENTLIYVAFYFSLGRLYSNSVLATLNARIAIRGLGEDSDELSFSLQTATKSCQPAFNTTSFLRPANISIKINTTQELTRDHQHMRDLEVSSSSAPQIPPRTTRSLP